MLILTSCVEEKVKILFVLQLQFISNNPKITVLKTTSDS